MMFKKIRFVTSALLLSWILAACASSPDKPSFASTAKKPNEDRAMLHTNLARGYMAKDQLGTARDSLEKALRLEPDHSETNYVMALLMLRLNNNDDASYYFEQAVKNNRENSAAAHDFGMFLCQTSKEKRAVEYFQIAASNPLFESAELSYMRAGECLARIGDDRAEDYLKQSLKMNPRLRPSLYRLARIKRDEGKNLNARAYIERYLAITKPQPEALLLAYQIESSLRANDVAERYRKQILQEFPASSEAKQLRDVERSN